MKRIAIFLAIFVLAACVPIPPDEPHRPEPGAKGGLEEFARVLATLDLHDDPSEYMDLLLEFEECIMSAWEREGNDLEEVYSDEELVVLVMYTMTTIKTGLMMQRMEEDESEGTQDVRWEHRYLILTLDYCKEVAG